MKMNFVQSFAESAATEIAYKPPTLSVIIPTFNERDNILLIVAAIERVLATADYEIVFVDDDSTDGTIDVLRSLTRLNPRVRHIHRIGRRGLASAVIEGMQSTSSPYLAVIDADLQHDEKLLPAMLSTLEEGEADLVVASRYSDGGGVGEWNSQRVLISAVATRIAGVVAKVGISDPMSGFFAISRDAFDSVVRQLSGQGYKILLDICASSKAPLRVRELPYEFRNRQHGESKLDTVVAWEYLMLLADKLFGSAIPARFLSFAIIGGLGVFVHFAVLAAMLNLETADFMLSQTIATMVAMVFNFFINNILTYYDKRLVGAREIMKGLASFVVVCSVGAVANVGVASYFFSEGHIVWWLSGLAGIIVGAVWNYTATAVFTWRGK
jgi:dolichol-phosphate mannosyltransferase